MNSVVRKRYVFRWVLTGLAAVLLWSLAAGGLMHGTTGAGGGTGSTHVEESSASFIIDGNAAGLISPGVKASLDLKFTNPHDFGMSVTDLSVTMRKVSAPNADIVHPCAIGDFAVDQAAISLEITLAARSASTLSNLGIPATKWPHVGMLNRAVNQDGCQGAGLTLDFTASGTRIS
jgi:hypothetical protein